MATALKDLPPHVQAIIAAQDAAALREKIMTKKFGQGVCADCGKQFLKSGPSHNYCQPCSTTRDLERKRQWARENPRPREEARPGEIARKAKARERGIEVSKAHAEPIQWDAGQPIDLAWMVRIAVPFSYSLSKNHIYTTTWHGHVALRKESRRTRESVRDLLVAALKDKPVVQNKVWIDIFVQKSNHKGDAVNVIDLVCDGIKEAVGIDDRWFSIRRLDWQIVKDDPQIFIGVGQESGENVHACSLCGRCLPFAEFNKNKSSKLGIGRECRECRRVVRNKGKAIERAA